MNSAQNPIKFRFSKAADGGALVDFYKSDLRRTANVFPRHDALIHSQAKKGRTVTSWIDGRLAAASSLYVMNPDRRGFPKEIDCVNHPEGRIERRRVVELGSVLREGNDPEDRVLPIGFWRLFLFGLPVIAALRFDVPFDLLLTEVFNSAPETKAYVRGDEETGSPLRADCLARPANELLEACGATSKVPIQDIGRDFFRISARKNLVSVAVALKNVMETGYVSDLRPKDVIGYRPDTKVYVDLSEVKFTDMSLEDTLDLIIGNRDYYENQLDRYASWASARHGFEDRIPRRSVIISGKGCPPCSAETAIAAKANSRPAARQRVRASEVNCA